MKLFSFPLAFYRIISKLDLGHSCPQTHSSLIFKCVIFISEYPNKSSYGRPTRTDEGLTTDACPTTNDAATVFNEVTISVH